MNASASTQKMTKIHYPNQLVFLVAHHSAQLFLDNFLSQLPHWQFFPPFFPLRRPHMFQEWHKTFRLYWKLKKIIRYNNKNKIMILLYLYDIHSVDLQNNLSQNLFWIGKKIQKYWFLFDEKIPFFRKITCQLYKHHLRLKQLVHLGISWIFRYFVVLYHYEWRFESAKSLQLSPIRI